LEVDHVDHDESEREHLRGLAAELGLLATGSSDYHGANKTVQLGENVTDEATYDEIVARATGAAVISA
jgi:3',5'-nucleoside bisphosphate phosphatase